MRSASQPVSPTVDPDVAATIRLLHRRHGFRRLAIISFIAFLLGYGGYANAVAAGTPPPLWFLVIVMALGGLTIVGAVAAVTDTVLLRRRTPAVRAQAAALAVHHPGRPHALHHPPWHLVTWILGWVGMLLILVVAVVSVSAVPDGVAYLAGAGNMVTFDPVSHQTDCSQYNGQYTCQTSTDGILETGGAGTQATWPDVVPLGKPFQVREPVWRWGLGGALIDSDRIAVVAVVIGLLIEGFGVLVAVRLVLLVRNWRRHLRQRTSQARLK
jgi:hypothetical protein